MLLVLGAALHLCLQNFPGLSQDMALRLGASCSKPGGLPEMGQWARGGRRRAPERQAAR